MKNTHADRLSETRLFIHIYVCVCTCECVCVSDRGASESLQSKGKKSRVR